MNDLKPFDFEGANVRVVMIDGEPWFVGPDVCRALDIGNSTMAFGRLDDDEKGFKKIETPGGAQRVTIVSESGLYALVMRCSGATTPGTLQHRFRRWVTSVVLPSIRKTGGFIAVSDDASDEEIMARGYAVAMARIEEKNARLAIAEPKAAALDLIAATPGSLTLTDAAKALEIAPRSIGPG